jgi:hypothetical protein
MTNLARLHSIIGLTVMLSLLAVTPAPSFASCRNSGGSQGSSKYGSQVNGGSVTICASAVAVTPARKTVVKAPVKVVAKTAPKSGAKPAAKAVAKPVLKSVPAFHKIVKPTTSPKPVIKKKVTAKVIAKPGSTNTTSATADFTPAGVNGNVYPSNELAVGQQASFTSTAVKHYRTGKLLDLPTEVQFTPISVTWNFGDGSAAIGAYTPHVFSEAGVHQVQVLVVYSVNYRVKGSLAWVAEPDTITVADEILVDVSADAELGAQPEFEETDDPRVLLVGQDCLSNPGSFGCN